MKPMLMRSQRPNLVCTKDFPVVLQAHFSAFPSLLPLQSTGLKQQSRTTQMSNPDGSRLHPYVNPPAAPPPGSPAPGQSRGGARSRERGGDGCLRFRPESVELPGSNNGRRFGPSLSSLAATVDVNLGFLCGCAV